MPGGGPTCAQHRRDGTRSQGVVDSEHQLFRSIWFITVIIVALPFAPL